MVSANFLGIEIDFVCLVIIALMEFNIWRTGDKRRIMYLSLASVIVLLIVTDTLVRASTPSVCGNSYEQDLTCSGNANLVMIYSIMNMLLMLIVPYLVFIILFFFQSNWIRARFTKVFLITLPVLVVGYFIVSSPSNGFIRFLTYKGAFVHGKYYYVLVAAVAVYSALAFAKLINFLVGHYDFIGEIMYAKHDLAILYTFCALPFAFAPFSLVFDIPLVNIGYTVLMFSIMSLHQHMRISIDDLTGLNNRNELRSYLDNLMSLSDQERSKTFMLFIDVNHFKSINDNYGHTEGDVVLMEISRLLKSVASTFNCFLCRYGGDEFILIKKDANEERASGVCRYIDKNVNSLKALSLAPYELSVSTGYVRFDKKFTNVQQFIDAADKIMYETKRSGSRDYSKLNRV